MFLNLQNDDMMQTLRNTREYLQYQIFSRLEYTFFMKAIFSAGKLLTEMYLFLVEIQNSC